MATQEKEARIFWSDQEWYDLMRYVVELRDRTHCGLLTALREAQAKVLPKARRRSEWGLRGAAANGTTRDYEMRYRAGWVPEAVDTPEQAAHVEQKRETQEDRDKALQATFTGHMVRWTEREWAMLALAVRHKLDSGDTRKLARIFFETQVEILPRDRCRPITALYTAAPSLQTHLDEAVRLAWTLPPEVQAKLTGREAEFEAHKEKSAAGLAEAQDAAASVIEAVSEAEAQALSDSEVGDRTEGPREPASEPQAPLAPPERADETLTLPEADPLALRVAMILSRAASQIAATTRQHVMAELDRQMDTLVAGMASSLRSHVQTILAAELGGPVKSEDPTPSADGGAEGGSRHEPPIDETPTAKAAPRLKVDVLGLSGNTLGEVKAAAKRLGIDATFVDTNKFSGAWVPKETVIVATRFVGHASINRAKSKGANILFANAGAQSVVGIMESLAEHRGALQ